MQGKDLSVSSLWVLCSRGPKRHDNDRKLPRTPAEIYDLNRAVASKMVKIFHSKGIPVVPTLGMSTNASTLSVASLTDE